MSRFARIACGSALILGTVAACATPPPGPPPAPQGPIDYYVRVVRAGVDRYDVSLAADEIRSDSIDFLLPAWTPGRYAEGSQGAMIENFSVRDGRGNPIATRRLGPDRWRLYPLDDDYLTIGYQVVPTESAAPLAFRPLLDLGGGYALGAGLFGALVGHESRPVTVAFELPSQWELFTPLEPGGGRRYTAPSFAALAATPFALGSRMRSTRLFVEGRTHQIVVQGAGPKFFPDSLLTLIGETIRHGVGFYGSPAYDRYIFVFRFVVPGTMGIGAMGQATGSAYFLPPLDSDRMRDAGIGGVLLHQYLHAWYPGAFGPTALVRPDFSRPPFVPEAWLIEGSAEYYARLLPVRNGDATRERFYDSMGEILALWRSLGGGSRIDVDALAGSGEDRATARLVAGGALAAFILDIAIHGDTRGRVGLGQVLDYLQRGSAGYDPTVVWGRAAEELEIPAEALSPLTAGASLSIESGLARAGLRIAENPQRRRTLGARLLVDSSGHFAVRDIESGGTAAAAGLREGDLLLEINGTPVGPGETVATRYALESYIRDASTGDRITFTVTRDGQPIEESGTVRESRISRVTIEEIPAASATALLVRSALFTPPPPVPTR